jgi:hypothetical protein
MLDVKSINYHQHDASLNIISIFKFIDPPISRSEHNIRQVWIDKLAKYWLIKKFMGHINTHKVWKFSNLNEGKHINASFPKSSIQLKSNIYKANINFWNHKCQSYIR